MAPAVKNLSASAGDVRDAVLILVSGRSPGGGNGGSGRSPGGGNGGSGRSPGGGNGGLGRSPGGENCPLLQYFCQENPIGKGARGLIVSV